MPLQKIVIKGNGLHLVLQRAREVLAASKTSWNFVRKSTVSSDLHDLGFVLTHQKFHFAPPDHFREVADLECRVQLSGEGHLNHQTTNSLHKVLNVSSLDSAISSDKSKILKNLLLSKSLDKVNLCARPTSTQGEPTSQQLTQSDDSERFHYDDEMDILM